MDEIWARLERFLQQNAPAMYAGLAPGATEDEFALAERRCGFTFPPDVRPSYLRHDGQAGDYGTPQGGTFIPGFFQLVPLSRALEKWEGNVETIADLGDEMPDDCLGDPGVESVFLDPGRFPFAKDIGGNQLCLDFAPAPGGDLGQVILFDHENSERPRLAASFAAWFDGMVRDLESGRSVWDADLGRYSCPD